MELHCHAKATILCLIRQAITVNLETMTIFNAGQMVE